MKSAAPNLFILGVAKSGTTTLADLLRKHPDIFITPLKEPTFFSSDINYLKGMSWYVNSFFENSGGYLYRGDASPSYLYFSEKVANRIQSDLTNEELRFIIIFRNPIDRAYSHYWHNVNRGLHERLTFEEALEAEVERLRSQDRELNDLGRIRYAYVSAGMYARQVKTFLAIFPREKFLMLLNEDIHPQNYQKTTGILQSFLGVRPAELNYEHSNSSYKPKSLAVQNLIRKRSFFKDVIKLVIPYEKRRQIKSRLLQLNAVATSYPPMNETTRKMLKEKFAPDVAELESLLERDLSTWLK